MSLPRRDFLRLVQAGAIASCVPWSARRVGAVPAARKDGPKYYIHFCLEGGLDPVYTVDPRRRSEVESWVDVPYAAKDIAEASGLRFGPHFAGLTPFADQLTVVPGILTLTANHQTGLQQAARLMTFASREAPSLFEILGEQRTTQPLGSVVLGWGSYPSNDSFTQGSLVDSHPGNGDGLLDGLDSTDPARLSMVAESFAKQAAQLRSRRSRDPLAAQAARHTQSVASFYERYAQTPRFAMQNWKLSEAETMLDAGMNFGSRMQRALWLVENDLTRCVYVLIGGAWWDTHQDNATTQTRLNGLFMRNFTQLLRELDTRKQGDRKLSELVSVSVSTEIGRFPRINSMAGKDHFPQVFMMMRGPWYQQGFFGHTDRSMKAAAVSLETGKPIKTAALDPRLTIDDFGTTLLRSAGIDDRKFGYSGRMLDFLIRA